MTAEKILVYVLRHDLRVSDNPIFHHLTTVDHGFKYVLPVFVFPPLQVELSGFLKDGAKSPYPPAKSQVGNFWRCGPHRAKFMAQSVWDLKTSLESHKSGLDIRLGEHGDVVTRIIQHFKSSTTPITDVWMTDDVSHEEVQQQNAVAAACKSASVNFKLWPDEKYYIDDLDVGLESPQDLPDVFTTYRKSQEPLRNKPRQVLQIDTDKLPRFPDPSSIPTQHAPFTSPKSLDDLEKRLCKPLVYENIDSSMLNDQTGSAHPFQGGEQNAVERVEYLVKSGCMGTYADTRNGLLGADFSTKLSAFLAFGCITARQVQSEMVKLEDGTDELYESTTGYGEGENDGTKAVRLELLWRDYMRLCTKKFGTKLFSISGFRHADGGYDKKWATANKRTAAGNQKPTAEEVGEILERFCKGTTGMGLIDASQRELLQTGYTSNRARQNVASFLAKHLQIDWRYGAEWYESFLVDYDVSSNWANWQYVSGVGNDPRGDARIFNPVKQAFDYDKEGAYVKAWVPEVKDMESIENVFQPWTASREELEKHQLQDNIIATSPLRKIEFTLERKPRGNRRPYARSRGRGGRGGSNGGGVNMNMNMNMRGRGGGVVGGHMGMAGSMPPPMMGGPINPHMYPPPMPYDAPPQYHWQGVVGMHAPPPGWESSAPPPMDMSNGNGNWYNGGQDPGGNPDFGRGGMRGGPRGRYAH